ncbi:MAG: N-acetyltransferase [Synechococcaceae cyanobacterium SM1_2_3]|nr:N-acetyltransferase [Synechococcaceae cyanobacterium SM1_2_3]
MAQAPIRKVIHSDFPAITHLAMSAFGPSEGPEIVRLISDLWVDVTVQPVLSLVATVDENIVGHIIFSNIRLTPPSQKVSAALLAPLAVHPDFQSQRIGSRLITEGLQQLSDSGVNLIFVLGHPGYYPRFGFSAAGSKGFEAPYPIPQRNAEAWMVRELQPGVIGNLGGRVICADALADPKYWRE